MLIWGGVISPHGLLDTLLAGWVLVGPIAAEVESVFSQFPGICLSEARPTELRHHHKPRSWGGLGEVFQAVLRVLEGSCEGLRDDRGGKRHVREHMFLASTGRQVKSMHGVPRRSG